MVTCGLVDPNEFYKQNIAQQLDNKEVEESIADVTAVAKKLLEESKNSASIDEVVKKKMKEHFNSRLHDGTKKEFDASMASLSNKKEMKKIKRQLTKKSYIDELDQSINHNLSQAEKADAEIAKLRE